MSQMKAGGQNGLKQLETSSCPLVLTLPCNLAQTSSNNTIFVSDDDYAEGRNLTRHVHFARYVRYLSRRKKGPLYLSAVTQTNNGQHINSFAQNRSLMTTISVSYNLSTPGLLYFECVSRILYFQFQSMLSVSE